MTNAEFAQKQLATPIDCRHCGESFLRTKNNQRICSDRCRRERERGQLKEYRS